MKTAGMIMMRPEEEFEDGKGVKGVELLGSWGKVFLCWTGGPGGVIRSWRAGGTLTPLSSWSSSLSLRFVLFGERDKRFASVIATDPAMVLDRLADPVLPSSCLLVVHLEPERAVADVRALTHDRGWPEIEVGREISAVLLNVAAKQRSRTAIAWLRAKVTDVAPGPTVLTGIDVLFEPSLELDPLALLRQMVRVTRVVAAWPGSIGANRLTYGVPKHAHYRTWSELGGEVTALSL